MVGERTLMYGILDKSPHFQLAPNHLALFIIRPIPNSPHTGSPL